MNIFEIVAIAITTALTAASLKRQQPAIAIVISIAGGMLIFSLSAVYLKEIFDTMLDIAESIDVDFSFINVLIKIIGIAYISEFASQVCRDAGEAAVALKMEFAGKILILFISAPIILSVIQLLSGIIQE